MKYNNLFKKYAKVALSLILTFAIMLSSSITTFASTIKKDYKTYVMAPLEKIKDNNWDVFKEKLITLKNNGVYAITTDIWWGYVEENGDNQFDWSYYKKYADVVRSSGLKWVPILSTHQCGGNVGNGETTVPLPSWLWTKDSKENMQFKNEEGQYIDEYLSPWWSGIEQQYDELYASFAENFSEYKDIIAKIYLSAGPSGELRYPSYNTNIAGWTYPERGQLYCYSEGAVKDFQDAMKDKYGTISEVNDKWETNLADFTQIQPPTDGDNFFINGYKTTYGNDFLTWYQETLEKHLAKMASKAHENFDSVFNVRIGAKVAGIHWLMNSPTMPHAAEYCAGLYNYSDLLDQFKKSDLDLTFTCLEMNDSDAYKDNYYSAPKSLVIEIANLAKSKGITMCGENALAIVNNNQGYQNSAEALFNYDLSGFTLLRINNLLSSNGEFTSDFKPFIDTLVRKPVPVTFTIDNVNLNNGEKLYLTGSNWEMANWTTGLYPSEFTCKDGKATITVYLGEGQNYEFKAIKKDKSGNVTWESGDNHSYTVPEDGGNYNWSWNN
ncbi:family 14 glycosylhydrolase [Clostridium sp. CTA-5]